MTNITAESVDIPYVLPAIYPLSSKKSSPLHVGLLTTWSVASHLICTIAPLSVQDRSVVIVCYPTSTFSPCNCDIWYSPSCLPSSLQLLRICQIALMPHATYNLPSAKMCAQTHRCSLWRTSSISLLALLDKRADGGLAAGGCLSLGICYSGAVDESGGLVEGGDRAQGEKRRAWNRNRCYSSDYK